jgi:hypothetical protein
MITATGYSKDPSILPEGIAVTFGKSMMEEQGGMKVFLQSFQESMQAWEKGAYWMHKCSNLPTFENIDHVYIIVAGRLYGRVYNGGFKKPALCKPIIGYKANGHPTEITWNHIILCGPFEKAPVKRVLKGFQGFRYTTKLF